jgi:hypothetical protein
VILFAQGALQRELGLQFFGVVLHGFPEGQHLLLEKAVALGRLSNRI